MRPTLFLPLATMACLMFGPGVSHAAGDVTEARVLKESANGQNWFVKGGNFRGEHFSPLRSVNDRNVTGLGLEWLRDLPVPDGISATPIVVDGVIYLSGAYSLVFAIDAASGDLIWQYDPDVRSRLAQDPGMSWPARVNRGVAVWHGQRARSRSPRCRPLGLARTARQGGAALGPRAARRESAASLLAPADAGTQHEREDPRDSGIRSRLDNAIRRRLVDGVLVGAVRIRLAVGPR